MPKILLGVDLVADSLLEDFRLRKAAFGLAVPEEEFLDLRLGVAAIGGGGGGGDVCLRELCESCAGCVCFSGIWWWIGC